MDMATFTEISPLTQAPKPLASKAQLDPKGFTPILKARKTVPKKIDKGNQSQNPSTANPFVVLVHDDPQ